MIPDEVVEQVRDSADIVQIIGEYVNLKRAGTDFRGPCPFHQGTHRNFSVSPKKHMYFCFVCHEGGDVFLDTEDSEYKKLLAWAKDVAKRRPDLPDPSVLIPTGWDALIDTIDRFVAVGTSKFVVLPIVEPSSPQDWVRHLEEAAPIVLARQT